MANTLKTSLVVFTRKGNMPALLSHYRWARWRQGGRCSRGLLAPGSPSPSCLLPLPLCTHPPPLLPTLPRPDYPIYCFTENELVQRR